MTSIIPQDVDFAVDESELCFADELVDTRIDRVVRFINEGGCFNKNMFPDGATMADVARMREEAEALAQAKKKRKRKSITNNQPVAPSDAECVASLVKHQITGEIARVEGKVDDLRLAFSQLQNIVEAHISDNASILQSLQQNYMNIIGIVGSISSRMHPPSEPSDPRVNVPSNATNNQPPLRSFIPSTGGHTDIIKAVVDSVETTYGDKRQEVTRVSYSL